MNDQASLLGRVLRSSTAAFSIGCVRLISEQGEAVPEFGALVKALNADGNIVYGLIYNVTIEDDAFVRQLVAAGVENEEYVEDQRQNRQVPIVVDVLVVAHGRGYEVYQRLPPQPPGTLDRIYACQPAELVRFSARHDWLRRVLGAADVPADALAAAVLRKAAEARPPDQREGYLVAAGRELATLLAMDQIRLAGILQQLKDRME